NVPPTDRTIGGGTQISANGARGDIGHPRCAQDRKARQIRTQYWHSQSWGRVKKKKHAEGGDGKHRRGQVFLMMTTHDEPPCYLLRLFITRTTVIHNVRYILPVRQIIVWSISLTLEELTGASRVGPNSHELLETLV